jgi:L,D-transpeptidase YcbB
MRHRLIAGFLLAGVMGWDSPASAIDAAGAEPSISAEETSAAAPGSKANVTPKETATPLPPRAEALQKILARLRAGDSNEERNEYAALIAFYEGRANVLLWLDAEGAFTAKARRAVEELSRAGDWGLDAKDFQPPAMKQDAPLDPESAATAETGLSLAVLKYARFARISIAGRSS